MALDALRIVPEFLSGVLSQDKPLPQKTDGQVIEEIEDLYRRARDDRRSYERDWQIILAFLKGQQWLEWNRSTNALWLPPAPPWRVRHVVNLMQPVYRTLFGKLTSQPLRRGRVRPANDTPDARQDALAQDELLEHLWTQCGSEEESLEVGRWGLLLGTGIHYIPWDKSKGDALTQPATLVMPDPATGRQTEVPNPQSGQPLREPNPETGEEDPEGNPLHLGDVDHISVSPFEFFPEPLVARIEDMEWVFYVKVRPASYVFRKFGVKLDEEQIPSDEYAVGNISGDDEPMAPPARGILCKAFFRRPTSEYPEGQYIVYASNQLLYRGPAPYPKDPLPFEVVRERMIPGRFWGRSVFADLVPLQRNYNKLLSQAIEIRNATARPKWHVFKNALDAGKTISTAPAEVIVTNVIAGVADGGRPTKIEGGTVPPSFFAEAEQVRAQFYEIAGVHDFGRGTKGIAGGNTFSGLNLMLEQDDTRIGTLRRDIDRGTLAVERMKLRRVKQFYIEPRTIAVVGADKTSEVKEFYAEKIPEDADVELIDSGNLPTSWAARQQYVMELMKTEVKPGSLLSDRRAALKLMGLADVEGIYDEYNRDVRQAQRENEKMTKGDENGQILVPPAHDYDNHLVHGQEHDSYRKGEEYEQLVAANPAIAQAFEQHVAQHRAYVQQALMMQAAVAPQPPQQQQPPQAA